MGTQRNLTHERKKNGLKMERHCIIIFVTFIFCINSVICNHRQKRSFVQMGLMIEAAAPTLSLPDLTDYGHWCGFGGSGTVVDEIDRCCKAHDLCYAKAQKVCKSEGWDEMSIYAVPYKWKFDNDTEELQCGEDRMKESLEKVGIKKEESKVDLKGKTCGQSVCLCDARIAACFSKNKEHFHESAAHPSIISAIGAWLQKKVGR